MLTEGGREEPLGVVAPPIHQGLLLHPHACWTCVRDRQEVQVQRLATSS